MGSGWRMRAWLNLKKKSDARWKFSWRKWKSRWRGSNKSWRAWRQRVKEHLLRTVRAAKPKGAKKKGEELGEQAAMATEAEISRADDKGDDIATQMISKQYSEDEREDQGDNEDSEEGEEKRDHPEQQDRL